MWNRHSEMDKKLMHFDIKTYDWYEAIFQYWKGIVQYILKDDISPEARKRARSRYFM